MGKNFRFIALYAILILIASSIGNLKLLAEGTVEALNYYLSIAGLGLGLYLLYVFFGRGR